MHVQRGVEWLGVVWRGAARRGAVRRANASETVSVIEPTTATRKRYFILGNVARRESSSGGRRSSVSLHDIDLGTLVCERAPRASESRSVCDTKDIKRIVISINK